MLYYVVLYYIISYYIILYCIFILYYIILCYVILYYIILYYILLYIIIYYYLSYIYICMYVWNILYYTCDDIWLIYRWEQNRSDSWAGAHWVWSLQVPGLPLVNMEGREYALEVAFCSRLSMAGDLGENGGKNSGLVIRTVCELQAMAQSKSLI